MDIFYWNINKSITDKKKEWIEKALLELSPCIFCLAEGLNDLKLLEGHLGCSFSQNSNLQSHKQIGNKEK